MNISFIVQARSGSTRLPNKMNLPFYHNLTILEIIIENLKNNFKHIPIIVATTENVMDNKIEQTSIKHNVKVFRGSEHNVLSRFIEAGDANNVHHIIRICADNPFISIYHLNELINFYKAENVDYVSYISSKNKPAMKTHYGFFVEIMSLKALKVAINKTSDKFYCEHVTNFIYENPAVFSLNFIKIPQYIEDKNIRLTVDTSDDFDISKKIYADLKDKEIAIEPENIINYLNNNSDFLAKMSHQIKLNEK